MFRQSYTIRQLKDSRGELMLSALLGLALILGGLVALVQYFGNVDKFAGTQAQNFIAKNLANELAEYFRSKTIGEIIADKDYPLCQQINYRAPSDIHQTAEFPDPVADIAPNALGRNSVAVRSYAIHVTNFLTMSEREDLCGTFVKNASLAPNDRFTIDVRVDWVEAGGIGNQKTSFRIVASVFLPDSKLPAATPAANPCDPVDPRGLITFEHLGDGTLPTSQSGWNSATYTLPIGLQYRASHGISFCRDLNGDKKCDVNDGPVTITTGNKPNSVSQVAFDCAEPRLCGPLSNTGGWVTDLLLTAFQPVVGDFFVTPGIGDTSPMLIAYDNPVSQASGQLLDVDDEAWTYYIIEAYGSSSVAPIDTITINKGQITTPGKPFGDTAPTGKGVITPWSFNRATADIKKIVIQTIGADGVALDNFAPSALCQYHPPKACDGDVSEPGTTLVDFEHLPNGTIPDQDPAWNNVSNSLPISSEYQFRSGLLFCQEDDTTPLQCSGSNSVMLRKDFSPSDKNAGNYYLTDNGAGGTNHPILITLGAPTDIVSGYVSKLDSVTNGYKQTFSAEAFDSTGKRVERISSEWLPSYKGIPWSFKSLSKNIQKVRISVNFGVYGIDNVSPSERCGVTIDSFPGFLCDPSVPPNGYPSHSSHPFKGFQNGAAGGAKVMTIAVSNYQDTVYTGGEFKNYGWRYGQAPLNIDVLNVYDGQEYWPFRGWGLTNSKMGPRLDVDPIDGAFPARVMAITPVSSIGGGKSRIYVGGTFTRFTGPKGLPDPAPAPPIGNHGLYPVRRIARLTFRGYLDDTDNFNKQPGFNNDVHAIALAEDGTRDIFVGGNFDSYGPTPVHKLVRLNFDGTVDNTFGGAGGGFDAVVRSVIVVNPDYSTNYSIYAAGDFTQFQGSPVKSILRLDNNSGVITANATFQANIGSGPNDRVQSVTWDSNLQKLYVVGDFTSFNGKPNTNAIVRLNPDGTLDSTFQAWGVNNCVYVATVANDGSGDVYIGGKFTQYRGVSSPGLVRLDKNGNIRASFSVGTGFTRKATDPDPMVVYSIATDCSNDIYVGGGFDMYQGVDRWSFIRLDENGNPK